MLHVFSLLTTDACSLHIGEMQPVYGYYLPVILKYKADKPAR